MVRKTASLVISFLFLYALPLQAETITIVTEILPPWQTTIDNRIGGIATDVVKATLAEVGVNAEINVYPWVRAYHLALEEKNVLIYSLVRTPAREPLFKWVGVIGSIRESFYRKSARQDIELNSLEDARKYVVIAPRQDFRHQFLTENKFETYLVNSQTQALKMLLAGRGDLILDDALTLSYELRQLNLDPSLFKMALAVPEISVDFEMAFSRNSEAELVERFRQGLETLKNKGIYDEIMTRHGIQAPAETP